MAGLVTGIIGLGLTAASTGMSFADAGKQRKAEDRANREAAKAMAAARKKLEVNYIDALAIQKEPYELQREAMLVAGAQAVEAARESERGAAAGVGRIQLAQQKGQAGIRTAMGQEMSALDRAAAAEESRLRDVGVQLDLGEVAGAQMAAADASQAATAAQTQGFQSLASFGSQVMQAAPLYAKGAGVRQNNRDMRADVKTARAEYNPALNNNESFSKFTGAGGKLATQQKFIADKIIPGVNIDVFSKKGKNEDGTIIGYDKFDEEQFRKDPQAYLAGANPAQASYLMNIYNPQNTGATSFFGLN